MPDLKSELSKVISAWDKADEPTTMTQSRKITTNTTRATFDKVKNNPGYTRAQLVKALETDGYKQSSTSSLITQLLANGNIRQVGEGIFANQNEYRPMQRITPIKHRVKKPDPVSAAPVVAPEPVVAKPVDVPWDADTVLNSLSIKQARSLYDELRKIFGG